MGSANSAQRWQSSKRGFVGCNFTRNHDWKTLRGEGNPEQENNLEVGRAYSHTSYRIDPTPTKPPMTILTSMSDPDGSSLEASGIQRVGMVGTVRLR